MKSNQLIVFVAVFVLTLLVILFFTGFFNPSKPLEEDIEVKSFEEAREVFDSSPNIVARKQLNAVLSSPEYHVNNFLVYSEKILFFPGDEIDSKKLAEDLPLNSNQFCLMKGELQDSSFEFKENKLVLNQKTGTLIARVSVDCSPANKLEERLSSYGLNFSTSLNARSSNTVCGEKCLQGEELCCVVILRKENQSPMP